MASAKGVICLFKLAVGGSRFADPPYGVTVHKPSRWVYPKAALHSSPEAIHDCQAERHGGLSRLGRNDDTVRRLRQINPSGKSPRSRKNLSSPLAKNFSLYLGTRHTSERLHPAR
jgi:hypothetical protein